MTKEIIQNYKICILDDKGVPKYYLLFISPSSPSPSSSEIEEFFSKVEWEFIKDKRENIFICKTVEIHSDDSVKLLKQKINNELQNHHIMEQDMDINDMYLFVATLKSFRPLSIYKRLTKNDTIPLTKHMLNQMMMNYYGLDPEEPEFLHHPLYETKNMFEYEDLLEFEWFYGDNQNTKLKKIPLGFRFIQKNSSSSYSNSNEDLFCSNPFENLFPILYRTSKDEILQAFDSDFLFRYGDFVENTIYLCTYADVNIFLQNNTDLLNIYFPYRNEVTVPPPGKKNDLFWEEQKLVDTIYNISTKIDYSLLNYKYFGISSFHFIIHPDKINNLPLETIFKNIHASIQIPIIQLHPGLRREKIYRLYYQQTAQNGNKIPFLKQETIKKLLDKPGKIANITMFILLLETTSPNFIHISFELNGNIVIKGENIKPMMPDVLNKWLQETIQPALQQINTFTQSSGYTIRPFQTIEDDMIEIISLQYNSNVLLNKIDRKPIVLEDHMGYFSPFFYNEMMDNKKGKKEDSTYKRYKRIEYFQRMNPHEEYISELLRFTQNKQLIQNKLLKKFSNYSEPKYIVNSMETADEILYSYAEKHHNAMIPSRYTNNKIEILEHTGFRCIFTQSHYDNEWFIEIKDITNIKYIYLLHNYLNTLFYVSINPEIVPVEIREKFKRKRIYSTPISTPQNPVVTNNVFIPIFADEVEDTEQIGEKDGEVEDEDDENYFFLQDDEEEEEEEEEKDEIEDTEQIGEKDEIGEKKIGGKKEELLTLSNYFIKRVRDRRPSLTKTGFARACPVNEKRQPIILTEDEKKQIDEEYTDPKNKPYGLALKHGLDETTNKQLYYICPEYWCIKPGQEGPLTESDVQQKKCGEIIQDPNKIKEGEYTYKGSDEFNDPGIVNRKINKGDVKIDKQTGKEMCIPCCFKKWHGKIQNERRFKQQCLPDEPDINVVQKPKKKEILPTSSSIRNILAMNYTPLPYGRIGLLPAQLQLFLNATTSNLCVDSNNRPKLNCPILVRYGAVQPNYNNQYFLGCLADIYAYQHKIQDKIITIKEIREKLCETITLDKFVQLHNATLVSLFRYRNDDFLTIEEDQQIIVANYENTELYKRLDIASATESHLDFFKSTILSYEHFLEYLRDDTVIVDHTYLWEIVCEKNPLLFPQGMNLVILEILNNDITNNIEIICPTSVYNFQLYDPTKETLLLSKQNKVYEPIYLYEITSLNPEIIKYTKLFQTFSQKDTAGLNTILQMIQSWLQECTPSQKNNHTVFTDNITAEKTIEILHKIRGYSILYQILNYQHKIIGFILREKTKRNTFFLPVFPSSAIKEIPTKWMDEPDIWNNYDTTVELLKDLHKVSDGKIVCKPLFRVMEDEKIVGIITMTNQFIQIMPYEDNRSHFQDDLKTMNDTNYMIADTEIFNYGNTSSLKKQTTKNISLSELSPKEKMVQYIRLENQFYYAFRNTIRLQLNLYKSRKTREEIQTLIFDKNLSFPSKLKKMKDILLRLMDGYFSFQDYDDAVLSKIRDVFNCQPDNCNAEPYCLLLDTLEPDGKPSKCQLILPKYNLINREKINENIYFTKISDEFIRYKRIRLFMLYPENNLHLSNSDYKIYSDEFIIPKSELLNETYFEELDAYPLPKYINSNTYDTAVPSDKYANPTQLWEDKYREVKDKERT